ncbi:diguanylate cyclase [Treponema sp.]|uniref:sensor domain-containing diguanylate cyclase n=1 Tax=Treponema sp. TaxID=166 RepID=UPI00388D71A8
MAVKSIRTKLTFLLFFIALIPLLLVITFYLVNNISSSIDNAKSEGLLRNSIVNEHITEHFERNLVVLRTVARNPMTLHYILAKPEKRDPLTNQTLQRANEVFNDTDNMIITDRNGDQIARTDEYPLINVEHRQYFHEAMHAKEYISDVLISLANNRMITVLEVPVLDEENNAVGMVQRDYDLLALQEYIQKLSSPETHVMITDSVGNIVAYSEEKFESNQLIGVSMNPAVAAALAGKTGTIDVHQSIPGKSKKERMLVSYSRNDVSGWVIITEHPYHYIWQEVVIDALTAVVLGGIMLFAIAVIAAFVAEKATRKIRAVSSLASKAASGSIDSPSFSELGDDELGQMAMAIRKIQSSRDHYQKDAEVDKLTGLLNKATFERLCRKALTANQEGIYSVLFVIDLDHFKEVNDTMGHQTGDAVLHDFAEALRRLFRPSDLLGRFGGDEFVVFLNDIPGKEIAVRKAMSILEAARNVLVSSGDLKVSASIGLSSAPQHGTDYDTLFSVADKSVYVVKESGRNGVSFGQDEPVRTE